MIYVCGHCKKETELPDSDIDKYLYDSDIVLKTPCNCKHFSYASTIKFKALFDPKDWKLQYGGSV